MRKKLISIILSILFLQFTTSCSENKDNSSLADSEKLISSSTEDFSNICNWNSPFPIELCRGWHASEVVGSGFADRYLFLENGTFYFAANEMTIMNGTRYMEGTWKFENGTLYLTIQKEIIFESMNNAEKQPSATIFTDDGIYMLFEYSEENKIIKLSISVEDSNEGTNEKVCILINGQPFWGSPIESDGVGYTDMKDIWSIFHTMQKANE